MIRPMREERRLYELQEELERLSRENSKVQLFICEQYSFIGTIETVEFDFIRGKEENATNPYVNIPIDKIQYIRTLK